MSKVWIFLLVRAIKALVTNHSSNFAKISKRYTMICHKSILNVISTSFTMNPSNRFICGPSHSEPTNILNLEILTTTYSVKCCGRDQMQYVFLIRYSVWIALLILDRSIKVKMSFQFSINKVFSSLWIFEINLLANLPFH